MYLLATDRMPHPLGGLEENNICYVESNYKSKEKPIFSRTKNRNHRGIKMDNIVAKRRLGEGRWDRALKKKMTELSEADNYDDAKHEWLATGNAWWR